MLKTSQMSYFLKFKNIGISDPMLRYFPIPIPHSDIQSDLVCPRSDTSSDWIGSDLIGNFSDIGIGTETLITTIKVIGGGVCLNKTQL